jgi:hypothetical protein
VPCSCDDAALDGVWWLNAGGTVIRLNKYPTLGVAKTNFYMLPSPACSDRLQSVKTVAPQAANESPSTSALRKAPEAKVVTATVVRLGPSYPFTDAEGNALNVIPGAIVCPDYSTVGLVSYLYRRHWDDVIADNVTRGQSKLYRGEAQPAPNLKFYGCTLVPPNTPMELERGNLVPVVKASLPDGTTVRGVTNSLMFKEKEP